ncbi:MAG: hypothetical protein Q8L87_14985, partial [Anaerolineales bacterium]|nr:hypothetical protein [Anaerolineales bacterium]
KQKTAFPSKDGSWRSRQDSDYPSMGRADYAKDKTAFHAKDGLWRSRPDSDYHSIGRAVYA